MSQLKLPKILNGQWIWHTLEQAGDCDRLLLRYDFQLMDIPAEADLWLASHSFFNVFINGRPCASGPIPHPGMGNNAFAMCYNITHMLEIGINRIAITAHTENTPISRVKKTIDGIWLQLDMDNMPFLWSNEDWICARPAHYEDTGLRTAPCDVFVEEVDFRKYNDGWMEANVVDLIDAPDSAWSKVDIVKSPSNDYGLLEPFVQGETTMELLSPVSVPYKGTFEQSCETAWISFEEAIRERNGKLGLYVAVGYVYGGDTGKDVLGLFVCDDPYMLFVNNELVKKQAVPPIPLREPMGVVRTKTLTPQELVQPEVEMKLRPGWNRIVIAQNCLSLKSAIVSIWPDAEAGSRTIYRKMDLEGEKGWSVAGPVNAPMGMMYPDFPIGDLPTFGFDGTDKFPNDVSAYYLTNLFTPELASALPMELGQSEYTICDFGQTRYCFPYVVIEGCEGDIVDVTCSVHCQNGEVLAYEVGVRRNTSTLILKEGENRWICSTQKGLRYVMVSVRKASGKVKVLNVQLLKESVERNQGAFQCSLPMLEQIWKIGANTLETTMQRIFIDSPTKDQTQYLADAMMQSLAAYYTFGAYDEARWALEAFADAQLDTGELNAASPSGLFQVLPDYSLAWPVWLHKHYLHTGDKDFLTRMMPALAKLMYYYNSIAMCDNGPLGDLYDYLGVYPFLDHGRDIDRKGVSTGLNSLYCRALRSAAWLATQMDDSVLAEEYNARADFVATQVWSLNWNEEKGMFADSSINGVQSESCSWQSSVLALYGGIAKKRHFKVIWDKLFTDDVPMELMAGGEYNNPFFKYFVLEAAFALGESEWGMRLIHYYWGQMAQAGATTWWEMFDPQLPDQAERLCAKCSGCAVTPNIFLISELVGIRPAEPGMKKVYFSPLFADVNWAKATIPTVHGYINVNWRQQEDGMYTANISANYPLEVITTLSPEVAQSLTVSVSENVTIYTYEVENN